MIKEIITQENYGRTYVKKDRGHVKKNPEIYGLTLEAVEIKTIPGQSQSVKELMERYEKGRPLPQE